MDKDVTQLEDDVADGEGVLEQVDVKQVVEPTLDPEEVVLSAATDKEDVNREVKHVLENPALEETFGLEEEEILAIPDVVSDEVELTPGVKV